MITQVTNRKEGGKDGGEEGEAGEEPRKSWKQSGQR